MKGAAIQSPGRKASRIVGRPIGCIVCRELGGTLRRGTIADDGVTLYVHEPCAEKAKRLGRYAQPERFKDLPAEVSP